MHGWLIGNGFMVSPAFHMLYHTLQDAAAKQDIFLELRTNDSFCPLPAVNSEAPDFVLMWDKDVRLAFQMESKGLRVFNHAQSIALCDDKTLTYLALNGRVPLPRTILAPLTFSDYGQGDFLDAVADELSYPYVLKEGCGSFGQQVYLIHSKAQALDLMNRAGEKPFLFQRFIRESAGHDVRVYIVGGQCIAAMERMSVNGDFRANIGAGGIARAHTLTDQEKQVALDAFDALHLTFAGVDLLLSDNGPLVCEVNSNAHFAALQQLTGVNPAEHILREIARQCRAS